MRATNIVKERRKRGAVCPRCRHPDYDMRPPVEGETLKPEFVCKKCGHAWAYGYNGGVYATLAKGV
jgi:transposase-like protein